MPNPTPTRASLLGVEGDGREPADYSDDELLEIAQLLSDEFLAAIQEEPEPNLERAKATYSSHCQPEDDEAFAAQADGILGLMESGFSVELVAVERESDNAALTLSLATIFGSLVRNEPSLMIFEDGRWLDSDCEAGRAAFYGTGDGSDEESTELNVLDLPTIPDVPFPELSDDPAEHTLEEIARSVEAILVNDLRAALAVPEPDLAAMHETYTEECRIRTDEELSAEANDVRRALQFLFPTASYFVTGIERINGSQAWVAAELTLDGWESRPTLPLLVAFENEQWHLAVCRQAPTDNIVGPDDVDAILRVSYIGESVQVHSENDGEPFLITVLRPPDVLNEELLNLPIRITSLADDWMHAGIGWISATLVLTDSVGVATHWTTGECGEDMPSSSDVYSEGESFEGKLCFAPIDESDLWIDDSLDRPASWLEFWVDPEATLLGQPVIVDLTTDVTPE